MASGFERRALQAAIIVAGFVPVGAGLAGVVLATGLIGGPGPSADLDSHFRFLSGLLLGIGLAFWGMVPGIERHRGFFRLLTGIVVCGGLARALGLLLGGVPSRAMLAALAMELAVTPLLCLWQGRVSATATAAAARAEMTRRARA
jgi:hypothetical protein